MCVPWPLQVNVGVVYACQCSTVQVLYKYCTHRCYVVLAAGTFPRVIALVHNGKEGLRHTHIHTHVFTDAVLAAGTFPRVIALVHSGEEGLRRECAFVLANPWALNVGIADSVAELLFKEGVIEVGCQFVVLRFSGCGGQHQDANSNWVDAVVGNVLV